MALGELAKPSVTLAVTLTTVTGYLLASGCLVASMWIPVLGVFVLAAGSAALNQWQERDIDARMPRTRHRPIPSGRIEPTTALFVAIVMMLAGLTLLTSAGRSELLLLALGGFALVWYNGVYTYLKRLTAFAVVPGALIGSVPPCIGYVAAGGDLHDPELLLVAMFFFIWQIPHFWLLMLIMGDEYEAAGLPSLTQTFDQPQLARITFMWLLATAASAVAFPAVQRIHMHPVCSFVMVAASVWLADRAVNILRRTSDKQRVAIQRAFWQVNVFALIVMVCLSASALTG